MINMFGNSFQQLESALAAREQAQGVNASNIANADTPNYRADTRSFADFLAEQNSKRSIGNAATTNPMHFKSVDHSSLDSPFQRAVKTQRMDGNTVDMQKEMANMSENQLMHELTIRLIKGELGGISNAIKEGSR